MAIPPQRLRLVQLRANLERARRRHDHILVALLAEEEQQARRVRRRRRWWVKPWLLQRTLYGQYDTLMPELMRTCAGDFKSFLRIEPEMFREMLDRVGPRITKKTE